MRTRLTSQKIIFCLFLQLVKLSSSTSSTSSSSVPVPTKHTRTREISKSKMRHKNSYHDANLGEVFVNKDARRAYKRNKLNSILNDSNSKIRVVFVNQTGIALTLCWVHGDSELHHFYRLDPCSPTITSLEGDGLQIRHRGSHLEHTHLGHSFVLGLCSENENDNDDRGDRPRIGKIVAGYRPTKVSTDDADESDSEEHSHTCVHLVTITKVPKYYSNHVRKKRLRFNGNKSVFHVEVVQCQIDSTPLDTSNKVYRDITIGGWKCKCEEGLFTRRRGSGDDHMAKVKEQLEADLLECTKKFPTEACKLLKKSTPIWINKVQRYGPKCAPIKGRGMCFHPHSEWLVENGMSAAKCGGVELYEGGKYLEDHPLWHGNAGIMLHELSHAFHNKYTEGGYSNSEIKECYEKAMEEKLYESVKVHTHKGGVRKCKAYAATDPMEYFAELSVAFLGGVGDDEDLEYNKWFPFNRSQLKDHDPRAFKMLQKMWGVTEES